VTGRTRGSPTERVSSATDAALDALDAAELRRLIREIIPWLDEPTYARLANQLVDRAARTPSEWRPGGPTDAEVSEIVAFAEAATRVGCAEPSEVDDYLRQGSSAFLGRDYPSALRVFRALLPSIANADIDLGQHEMIDEVLGVDVLDCAVQYMVCTYVTAAPPDRAEDVLAALDEVRAAGRFWALLAEMERVALARGTKRADDLSVWCRTLLKLAGVTGPGEGRARTAMLAAMRNAAERRIQAVTGSKRRRHYGHAAALALACGTIDPTPEGRDWPAALRQTYRRYPALQRELSGAGGVD